MNTSVIKRYGKPTYDVLSIGQYEQYATGIRIIHITVSTRSKYCEHYMVKFVTSFFHLIHPTFLKNIVTLNQLVCVLIRYCFERYVPSSAINIISHSITMFLLNLFPSNQRFFNALNTNYFYICVDLCRLTPEPEFFQPTILMNRTAQNFYFT